MRLWRDLSPATKQRYRGQGATPSAYNAWQRKTPAQRAAIKAVQPGAKSGPAALSAKSRQDRARRAEIIGDRDRNARLRDKAYRNMVDVLTPFMGTTHIKHEPNTTGIRERVDVMTRDELVIASVADFDTIRALASNQKGWRPVQGKMVNPFWYG